MVISFWSSYKGRSGTSTNIAVLGAFMSKHLHKNVLIVDFNFLNKDIIEYFTSEQSVIVTEYYSEDNGVDALCRNIKLGGLSKEDIYNCSLVLEERLYILPPTKKLYEQIYKERMTPRLKDLISTLRKEYDYVFIDMNTGEMDYFNKEILAHSDYMILNTYQNKKAIKSVVEYKEYDFPLDKIFYCIGSYVPDSRLNMFNIRRIFRIGKQNLVLAIPRNLVLMDALSQGQILTFINSLSEKKTSVDSNYFFQTCYHSAKAMVSKIEGGKEGG